MAIDTTTDRSDFALALESSFIAANPDADGRFTPRIITNEKSLGTDVLSVLKGELYDCTSFDFSVAFITSGGIQTLVELFSALAQRGIPGRILTSTYLNFNHPDALRKLLEYPNIEARVFQGDLHAKGYFFDRDGLSTILIGSSNLTQKALTCNREWNVLFRSFSTGKFYQDAREQFELFWNDELTVPITPEWIDKYEGSRPTPLAAAHFAPFVSTQQQVPREGLAQIERPASEGAREYQQQHPSRPQHKAEELIPNKMQTHALEALRVLHDKGERRALLISATGTGKTYLSSFDVRETKPRKVLFVAHRKRILEASRESFHRVLGSTYSYGYYEGGSQHPTSTCVFAMVNTLSRHLDEFGADEFDYIIIDEAHRTGAQSYQKILDHFDPRFCLGMTATPSRTDGYDVYGLFNHLIAYRITLNDALENEMLAPFHYFGIADLEIDDETIDDLSMFSRLASEERVRHITEKIESYTVNKSNRKGLIFCNRNDEAARLSDMFNELGYRTVAISGATSDYERNRAIERLERGELEYIFSVDILNEGVDIPSLNQIIMLRRTESPVVFIQQLGRGLRQHAEKEYTLVLDFIGNYQQNYLVPIALSGDRTYNKDNLRRVVRSGSSVIPGASTVTFDAVSERRIFKALEQGRFSETKLIRQEYEHLRQMLGRVPRLVDFDENEAMDPLIIIKKFGSYAAFKQTQSGFDHKYGPAELQALRFLSQKLASGKRYADLALLESLVQSYSPEHGAAKLRIPQMMPEIKDSVSRVLSGSYSTGGFKLVKFHDDGTCELGDHFRLLLADETFRADVLDCIEFGLSRNGRLYSQTYKDTDFVLYAKYTREEVCRLLRWEREPNYQNIGGYFHDKGTNTFPVFINYEKDPSSISITTMYEDRFVSEDELIAISKSKRTLGSPEIVSLGHASENGMRCFLFVRKNKKDKDDGTEFYFLGEMHPTGKFEQFIMEGTQVSAVEITYRLEEPVRQDLYEYFLSDLDA